MINFALISNNSLFFIIHSKKTMKHISFLALALLVLACNPTPKVKINYLEPVLYIGEENRIEAEIAMSEPIDKIMIMLKNNQRSVYVDESDIEYESGRKRATFSTKITLPEETQRGADSILIGAWDVNNKQVDKRLQIWIGYPDSRFEEAAKKASKIDE